MNDVKNVTEINVIEKWETLRQRFKVQNLRIDVFPPTFAIKRPTVDGAETMLFAHSVDELVAFITAWEQCIRISKN